MLIADGDTRGVAAKLRLNLDEPPLHQSRVATEWLSNDARTNGKLMKLRFSLFFILSLNGLTVNAETATKLVVADHPSLNSQASAKPPTKPHDIRTDIPFGHQVQDQIKRAVLVNKDHFVYQGTKKQTASPISRWTLPSLVGALALLLWVISRSQRHG